jgi:hypothetical protein
MIKKWLIIALVLLLATIAIVLINFDEILLFLIDSEREYQKGG